MCVCGFICLSYLVSTSFLAPLLGNGSCSSLEPSHTSFFFMFHTMDHIPIIQFAALKGVSLEPPPSSKPILTNSYEIQPCFITKVQELSFARGRWQLICSSVRVWASVFMPSYFGHVTWNPEVEAVSILFDGISQTVVYLNHRECTRRVGSSLSQVLLNLVPHPPIW
jgi:hypothetical protein